MEQIIVALFLASGITTRGSCSPIIDRTARNVTVECGTADIEISFLLKTIGGRCGDFDKGLTRLEAEAKDEPFGLMQVSKYRMPTFDSQIIEDVRRHSYVVYQYDRQNFPQIFGVSLRIPSIYDDAMQWERELSYDIGGGNQLSPRFMRYLSAVKMLCEWAGHPIDVNEWQDTSSVRW